MSLLLTGAGGGEAAASIPLAKVQAFTVAGGSSVATQDVAINATTTATNHLVLMVGLSGGKVVSSVADSKSNTWTVHYVSGNGSQVGLGIASCKITTPLVNGDTITITPNAACFMCAVAQEYSGLDQTTWLRTKAGNGQGWLSSTSATGGATAGNSTAGDLVIGAFSADGGTAIGTPGAGYTDETGIATTGTVIPMDWESKVATGGSAETATATWDGSSNGCGGTIVFAKAP